MPNGIPHSASEAQLAMAQNNRIRAIMQQTSLTDELARNFSKTTLISSASISTLDASPLEINYREQLSVTEEAPISNERRRPSRPTIDELVSSEIKGKLTEKVCSQIVFIIMIIIIDYFTSSAAPSN
jgi:hypothetical protein